MKPTRIVQVLDRLRTLRWPVFLWGPPGVGKSSIVKSVAASAGRPVLDLRASLLDPTDLRGIPAIQDGRSIWCPPQFLPAADQPPGILFLDEINAAPPMVQAALYQLVLDRRVGEYELPEGWWIVAAGNRHHDRAVVYRLSSALANRFVHIDFDVDFADWRGWSVDVGIHHWVAGFLALRPALLCTEPGDQAAYPTPRSWEMASDILKRCDGIETCRDILPGVVGEAAAAEFSGWIDSALREADLLALLKDPAKAPVPERLGDVYALISWFAVKAKEANIRASAAVLLDRLPVEFAVVLARDMLRGSPSFIREDGYKRFVKAHGDLLGG